MTRKAWRARATGSPRHRASGTAALSAAWAPGRSESPLAAEPASATIIQTRGPFMDRRRGTRSAWPAARYGLAARADELHDATRKHNAPARSTSGGTVPARPAPLLQIPPSPAATMWHCAATVWHAAHTTAWSRTVSNNSFSSRPDPRQGRRPTQRERPNDIKPTEDNTRLQLMAINTARPPPTPIHFPPDMTLRRSVAAAELTSPRPRAPPRRRQPARRGCASAAAAQPGAARTRRPPSRRPARSHTAVALPPAGAARLDSARRLPVKPRSVGRPHPGPRSPLQ